MLSTEPTPYLDLNQVLEQLVQSVQAILREKLLATYLQGSFALRDFDEHSDVDFIMVVSDEPNPGEVEALQHMHERIYNLPSPWAQHLEGSYFPAEILRSSSAAGVNVWYLDHGAQRMIRANHCNTLVVRSTLLQGGVRLYGPDPAELIDPIPPDVLRAEIYQTMHQWGGEILTEPEKYRNRFYQGYLVLNYSRMLHDLIRGCPGTKRQGAEWAKDNLDPSWIDLIDRAWDCRPDPARAVRQPPDPRDFERTLAFIRYLLVESAKAQ